MEVQLREFWKQGGLDPKPTYSTIHKWIGQGRLKGRKRGNAWYVTVKSLRETASTLNYEINEALLGEMTTPQ